MLFDMRNASKTRYPKVNSLQFRRIWLARLLVAGLGCSSISFTGCNTTSPFKSLSNFGKTTPPSESANPGFGASMGTSLSNTGKAVKNQFSSVSSAVSSAVTKTKTAISSPFTPVSSTTATAEGGESPVNNPLNIKPEIFVYQGNYFESQGNYTKAADSYSRALQSEPKNASALISMARLYDRQQDPVKATEFYQRVIEVAPNNADAYLELGNLQANAGDLKGAQENFSKATTLQPSNKSYRHALAGALLDSGDPNAALAQMTQCESPAMAQYQMAYMHFQRKNMPATQQHLSEALQIDPNLKPARDLLASIGGAQGLNGVLQQGQQYGQQAMGIYQQAGAVVNGITNSMQGTTTPPNASANPALPSSTNLLGIPVTPLQAAPTPVAPTTANPANNGVGVTVRFGQ